MIKFTDEFIKEADYLYQLADKFGDLSANYLDALNDELFIKRLNDLFRAALNQAADYLSNEYNKPIIISAIKNYLIGLSCLNENALACEFLNNTDLS